MTSPAQADAASLLAVLPSLSFGLVLLLARLGAASMLLPLLGEAEVPATVRAGLALVLSIVLLPELADRLPAAPSSPILLLAMTAAEIVAGLFIGWLARLVLLALSVAGQLIALATNLASVIQPDPVLGVQNAALGRLLTLAAPAILAASGLYAVPLRALADSYIILPPGQVLPAGDTLASVVGAAGGMMALALRLAAPFLLASLVWNVALGLLGRVAPALPLSGLAGPLQLLGGLLLLALLLGQGLRIWAEQAGAVFAALPGA